MRYRKLDNQERQNALPARGNWQGYCTKSCHPHFTQTSAKASRGKHLRQKSAYSNACSIAAILPPWFSAASLMAAP
jgi:hypothetical protein